MFHSFNCECAGPFQDHLDLFADNKKVSFQARVFSHFARNRLMDHFVQASLPRLTYSLAPYQVVCS